MSFDHLTTQQLRDRITVAKADAALLRAEGSSLWRVRSMDARTLAAEFARRQAAAVGRPCIIEATGAPAGHGS